MARKLTLAGIFIGETFYQPLAKSSLHFVTSVVARLSPGRELVHGSLLPGMNSRCVLLQEEDFNFR